jgi:hypothetical protein
MWKPPLVFISKYVLKCVQRLAVTNLKLLTKIKSEFKNLKTYSSGCLYQGLDIHTVGTIKTGNFVIAGKDRQGVDKICSGPSWLICIDIDFMKKIRLTCYSFLNLFCLIIFFILLKFF